MGESSAQACGLVIHTASLATLKKFNPPGGLKALTPLIQGGLWPTTLQQALSGSLPESSTSRHDRLSASTRPCGWEISRRFSPAPSLPSSLQPSSLPAPCGTAQLPLQSSCLGLLVISGTKIISKLKSLVARKEPLQKARPQVRPMHRFLRSLPSMTTSATALPRVVCSASAQW